MYTNGRHWGKTARRYTWPHDSEHWWQPAIWNKKAERNGVRFRVFCGSMCDVMEDRSDLNPERAKLFELIEQTPHLDWLLLTKRPQNYRRFLPNAWIKDPMKNVWLMTTVESQDYIWRIDGTDEGSGCRLWRVGGTASWSTDVAEELPESRQECVGHYRRREWPECENEKRR